jgi:hypothetical protein
MSNGDIVYSSLLSSRRLGIYTNHSADDLDDLLYYGYAVDVSTDIQAELIYHYLIVGGYLGNTFYPERLVEVTQRRSYRNKDTYTWSQIDVQPNSGGGVVYTAGNNIQIENNVISATDTKYSASDFDIKDLSDSTDLKSTWNNKQNVLTSGDGIDISSNEVSVKYDNETIVLDENGKLKSVASGGLSGDYLPQVKTDLADYECEIGTIVQYTGSDTDRYINGYIYKRIAEGGYEINIPTDSVVFYFSDDIEIDESIKSAMLRYPYFYRLGDKIRMIHDTNYEYAWKYNPDRPFGEVSLPDVGDYLIYNYQRKNPVSLFITGVTESQYMYEYALSNGSTYIFYKNITPDNCRISDADIIKNSQDLSIVMTNELNYDLIPSYPNSWTLDTQYVVMDGDRFISFTSTGSSCVYKNTEVISITSTPWVRIDVQPAPTLPYNIEFLSQAEYDQSSKDENTIYLIPVSE